MSISIPEIMRELTGLPEKRIAEVYDFVLFLKTREQDVDVSDDWSEEDMRDATIATMRYAEAELLNEDSSDASVG
jgi:hypothetical protein